MRRSLAITGFLVLSLACSGFGKKKAPESDVPVDDPLEEADDTEDTEEATEPLTLDQVWVDWQNDGGTIVVDHPEVDGFTLGLAGTYDGWMGEDCFEGSGAYHYCHTFDGSDAFLETVGQPEDIVEGSTTLFSEERAIYEGQDWLTYLLEVGSSRPELDATCYVWGKFPSYYEDFGCEVWEE